MAQYESTPPPPAQYPISYSGEGGESLEMLDKGAKTWKCLTKSHIIYFNGKVLLVKCLEKQPCRRKVLKAHHKKTYVRYGQTYVRYGHIS